MALPIELASPQRQPLRYRLVGRLGGARRGISAFVALDELCPGIAAFVQRLGTIAANAQQPPANCLEVDVSTWEDKVAARAPVVELELTHKEMAEGAVLEEEQQVALVLEHIQLVALEVQLFGMLQQPVDLEGYLEPKGLEVLLAVLMQLQSPVDLEVSPAPVQKDLEVLLVALMELQFLVDLEVVPAALVQKDLEVVLVALMELQFQMDLEVLLEVLLVSQRISL